MSAEIKHEITDVPSPEPMDDENDELLNEICANIINECKKEIVEEKPVKELRNNQEDSKRKLEECINNSVAKTEKTTSKVKEELDGEKRLWCQDEEDYESVPKRIRESHSSVIEQEQRPRNNSASSSSTTSSGPNHKKQVEYESEPSVLARRQKDIDYGKNTIGYDRYVQQIPKDKRLKDHPRTPPMHLKYTRRGWDGMVKLWRKQLHIWDPPKENSENDDDDEGEEEETEEKNKENGATCQ